MKKAILGMAMLAFLPKYDMDNLRYIIPFNPPFVGLGYDTDGDNIEDLRELRIWKIPNLSPPIKIFYDLNRDGEFQENEVFEPENIKYPTQRDIEI